MTTKQSVFYGTACLLLAIFPVGCNREEPATMPQGNATPVTEPAESAAGQPSLESPSPTAIESHLPETAIVIDAPDVETATDYGTKEGIAADLKQLANPRTSPAEWEAAQNRILEQAADAVPGLAVGLTSGKPLEREMAATMLAAIGSGLEEAEQPLRDALRDESAYVRANAATALCQLPDTEDAVIPVLAKLLQSPDPNLRQIAATNLGNFGPEAAPFVESLAGSLEDDRPDVLMPIVELLGRIGPPAEAAAPKLRQIVFEQSGDVQAAATAALEQIEGEGERED